GWSSSFSLSGGTLKRELQRKLQGDFERSFFPLPGARARAMVTVSRMKTVAHAHTNRLAHEKSPYLLQHAHNPVDWFAWCDDAFAKARAENKPLFLSIGYSTCHWCHVMERES